MTESSQSDIAKTFDTPSAHDADALPSDVIAIVESLEAEAAEEAGAAGTTAEEARAAEASAEPEAEAAAPSPDAEGGAAQDAEGTGQRGTRVPWWPFLAYLGAWAVVSGVAAWFLLQVPPGEVVYATELYERVVQAGLVLTSAGPCLIFAVWLAALVRSGDASRGGLFIGSLIRGAFVTLGGVVMWCAMFVIVDTLRLGRPL